MHRATGASLTPEIPDTGGFGLGEIPGTGVATSARSAVIRADIVTIGTVVGHRPETVEECRIGSERILEGAPAILGVENHRLGSKAWADIFRK
jgi:hypothetical protein